MTPEQAERVALEALAHIIGSDELCPIFMGSTGASSDDLSVGATDPAFLASVLEFLTMDDQWVIAFCDAAGHSYDMPLAARNALPGGASVHWT